MAAIAQKARADNQKWYAPTDRTGLEALMPSVRGQMEKGLPAFMRGQADRLLRCLITETHKTPALLECTPISLFAACIQAGQLGLTIGGPQGESYVVPFKLGGGGTQAGSGPKTASLLIGYKGFKELAYRTDKIRRISPGVVRKNDEFDMLRGTTQYLTHREAPVWSQVVGYYVVVELSNGGTNFEYMNYDQIIAHRDRYATTKAYQTGPWYSFHDTGEPTNDFNGMALKTVFRRMTKNLPMSPELAIASGLDEQAERGEPQNLALTGGPMPDVNDESEGTDDGQAGETEKLRNRMGGVPPVPPSPPPPPPPSPPTTVPPAPRRKVAGPHDTLPGDILP